MTDVPARKRFGPDRITLIPVIFFALGSLPIAASSSRLTWLFGIPVGCAVWVLRARVVAAPVGIEICNGFRVHQLAWAEVAGFTVPKRGPVRLLRTTGRPLLMTSLPRRQLPALIEVAERPAAG